jgi:hypothetical protein
MSLHWFTTICDLLSDYRSDDAVSCGIHRGRKVQGTEQRKPLYVILESIWAAWMLHVLCGVDIDLINYQMVSCMPVSDPLKAGSCLKNKQFKSESARSTCSLQSLQSSLSAFTPIHESPHQTLERRRTVALEHRHLQPRPRRRRRRLRDLSRPVRGVLSIMQDAGGRLSIE